MNHTFTPIHYRLKGTFCSICHKPKDQCKAWQLEQQQTEATIKWLKSVNPKR